MIAAAGEPTVGEIQEAVREILSRDEFRTAVPAEAPRKGLLDSVWEWLGSHYVFGDVTVGRFLFWILMAAVAAVLVWYLSRLLGAERGGVGRGLARRGARAAGARQTDAGQDPAALFASSEAALAAGDARAAVMSAYRACIRMLSITGHLSMERWKTNTAYLRECPRTLACYPAFRDLTEIYDELVYGHRAPAASTLPAVLSALKLWGGAK